VSRLVIIVEEDSCFRECQDCGDEIPDPYLEDEDDEREVLCSTCTFKYKPPAGEGPPLTTEPVRCVCDKPLSDCHANNCLDRDRHPSQLGKRQRSLF